jgi:hypothetical protein
VCEEISATISKNLSELKTLKRFPILLGRWRKMFIQTLSLEMERDNFNVTQKPSAQIMQRKVSSSPISNKYAVTKFQIHTYLSLLRHYGVFFFL